VVEVEVKPSGRQRRGGDGEGVEEREEIVLEEMKTVMEHELGLDDQETSRRLLKDIRGDPIKELREEETAEDQAEVPNTEAGWRGGRGGVMLVEVCGDRVIEVKDELVVAVYCFLHHNKDLFLLYLLLQLGRVSAVRGQEGEKGEEFLKQRCTTGVLEDRELNLQDLFKGERVSFAFRSYLRGVRRRRRRRRDTIPWLYIEMTQSIGWRKRTMKSGAA
jgi:hypothetical protein